MAKAIRLEYPDFKILFMDNGSTDGTIELVNRLNDPFTAIFSRQ